MFGCLMQRQRARPNTCNFLHFALSQLNTLVIGEHKDSRLAASTLHTITAACALGQGDVSVLVAGSSVEPVSKAVQNITGVDNVLVADHENLSHHIAEPLSDLVVALHTRHNFSHILAPSSTFGRNLLPRAAALLDCQPVSDVTEILDASTYVRPIYAGNALETVQCSADSLQMFSVRTTAFEKATTSESASAAVEPVSSEDLAAAQATSIDTRWEDETVQKSTRPELGAARVVISGGRALKTKENFQLLESLADKVGGAVGASRAAVDAGLCPNDMQVGQTGKVVAPELYIALGISGAIQHLAGMKDSKCIVAINSDPDAPIFQVADYGLVGNLFNILPELEKEFASLKT
ncbi:hypothetical protein WJX77_009376 [Trebouxia sp. C0004]